MPGPIGGGDGSRTLHVVVEAHYYETHHAFVHVVVRMRQSLVKTIRVKKSVMSQKVPRLAMEGASVVCRASPGLLVLLRARACGARRLR